MAGIWDGRHDGVVNMARDAALVDALAGGARWRARVYGWTQPWITLGAFQDPGRDLLPDNPLAWTRRTTGGRAVLHGHDVTLGLAVRLEALTEPGESPERLERAVRTVYRRVIAPLVEALNEAGVPCALGEDLKRHGGGEGAARISPDCFAAVSANDVVDRRTGRKVGGCALRIVRGAALLQASIPNSPPLVDPARCFRAPAFPTPVELDAEAFAPTWEAALARAWGG